MSKPKSIVESLGSTTDKIDEIVAAADLKDPSPSIGKKFPLKTEKPDLPVHGEPAFHQFRTDEKSAGNYNFTINRKEHGNVGLFRNRDKIVHEPIKVNINVETFYRAIHSTLSQYLEEILRKKSTLNDAENQRRARSCAEHLTNGCCIMAYLKVRSFCISEFQDDFGEINLDRPKVGHDHVIPLPFAFAIQQLGIVHVVDLEKEVKYAPVFPRDGHTFGIPPTHVWNSNAYYDSVAFARNLGMQFSIVDLKEKKGTAWWMLQPYYNAPVLELRCPIPETNFTTALALTYALFLPREPNCNATMLFDTQTHFTASYGTMLRSPHNGINLTMFESISGTETDVWTHT